MAFACEAEIVVIGGGIAGLCAALAAARSGCRTALISDRPVLGGSASSEIRVTPSSANHSPWNCLSRESGIMEEITLRLARKVADSGRLHWPQYDELFFDMVHEQPNLQCFLNTSVFKVNLKAPGEIQSVEGLQLRSEKLITFTGRLFIDCTGDGTVGFLAGAAFRVGREARSEFNEPQAPEAADRQTMGATLLFTTVDRGHPVPFKRPEWALDVSRLSTLTVPAHQGARTFDRLLDGSYFGPWWAEYGGAGDSIHEDDDVVWHTRRLAYGLWDYIKNSGKFDGVERFEIDWIGYLPGKRESRRLMGPCLPTGNDFMAQKTYDDAIGYAGWPIDVHPPLGYRDPLPACTHDWLPGITDIPFGSLYSGNVANLLFAGRNVSASHIGLGVVRIMGTTAVMGQAAGAAAALCARQGLTPDALRRGHMPELQRRLAREDQSIIGYRLLEKEDLSRTATLTASSERRAELLEGSQWQALKTRMGLLLPVATGKLDAIRFLVRAVKDSSLRLRVYACHKPQNYRMDRLVADLTVPVTGSGWVGFPVDAAPSAGQKLFFVLDRNPDVLLACEPARFPGILAFEGPDTPELTADGRFRIRPLVPCFAAEPLQRLYGPEQLINGHIRPHGLPNAWSSGPLDPAQPAWVELAFAGGGRKIGSAELVFSTDLGTRRFEINGLPPELVRDYEVAALVNGRPEVLVRERDNARRFRRHVFTPVQADGLRLTVYRTWGAPHAELYDCRVYPE
jgi:hypothetical protein